MSENYLQLLELLNRRTSDDGKTSREIAELLKVSVNRAAELLALAQAEGRLVVGRRQKTTIDGRKTTVPVYSITEGKEGKNGKAVVKHKPTGR